MAAAIDPNNPNVVWVGSGENNNQRSVDLWRWYLQKRRWREKFQNMGLTKSEHIGNIAIDPENGDIVYVAAYGPGGTSGERHL